MQSLKLSNNPLLWLMLAQLPGFGVKRLQHCQKHVAQLDELFTLSKSALRGLGLSERLAQQLSTADWHWAESELTKINQKNIELVTFNGKNYPELLRESYSPPLLLYAQGDTGLLHTKQLGVVGARMASPQARQDSFQFGKVLAESGLVVTSGLALGVDSAAHRGALTAGQTIAVLGSGLGHIYPAENKNLARQIIEQGLLVSEFPYAAPPKANHFPRRNRIISGLSLGVLVVEAAMRSGSLLTAKMALEDNREVFALPGSIHNPRAKGCLMLLQQGAKLVQSVDDILEELGPLKTKQIGLSADEAIQQTPLEPGLLAVYDGMGSEAMSVDALVALTGESSEAITAKLMILELKNYIIAVPGGYVRAKEGTKYERTCA